MLVLGVFTRDGWLLTSSGWDGQRFSQRCPSFKFTAFGASLAKRQQCFYERKWPQLSVWYLMVKIIPILILTFSKLCLYSSLSSFSDSKSTESELTSVFGTWWRRWFWDWAQLAGEGEQPLWQRSPHIACTPDQNWFYQVINYRNIFCNNSWFWVKALRNLTFSLF